MADPFIAEIRIFPFNFAPMGWAFCDGQTLSIAQNSALYALIGITYGGDGKTNFALPNLQGRVAMHPGQGPGLSPHRLGETGGSETVTLNASQLSSHTHNLKVSSQPGEDSTPVPNESFARSVNGNLYQTTNTGLVQLSSNVITQAGGGQPHNNLQPYLALNFCIAVQGIFPPRG